MPSYVMSFLMPLTALQTSIGMRFVTARGFPGDQRRLLSLQHVPGPDTDSSGTTSTVSTSRVHFKDLPEYINLPLGYQGLKTKIVCNTEFPWATYVVRSAIGNPRITVEMKLYFQDCYCGEIAPEWIDSGTHEVIDVLAECLKRQQREALGIKVPPDWIRGLESNVSCTSVIIEHDGESNILRQVVLKNLLRQLRANLRAHFAQILVTFTQWNSLTLSDLKSYEASAAEIKRCMYGNGKAAPKK